MKRVQLILAGIFVLLIAAATRFVSMAGLSISQYGKVIDAYFQTSARAEVFLGQYVFILVTLVFLFLVAQEKLHIVIKAAAFYCLVSLARYFIPIYLISNLGDLLVLVWMFAALGKKSRESA